MLPTCTTAYAARRLMRTWPLHASLLAGSACRSTRATLTLWRRRRRIQLPASLQSPLRRPRGGGASPSTPSRGPREFWISPAPRSTTSCGATECGETDPPHPADGRKQSGTGAATGCAGTIGGRAGPHVSHTVPDPAGDLRPGLRFGCPAQPILLDGGSATPGAGGLARRARAGSYRV